ncbi:hypothetical protein NL676_016113 [Syzygium grande]|nr:hypothetical protein NL676_016113 [Syzygium grande]
MATLVITVECYVIADGHRPILHRYVKHGNVATEDQLWGCQSVVAGEDEIGVPRATFVRPNGKGTLTFPHVRSQLSFSVKVAKEIGRNHNTAALIVSFANPCCLWLLLPVFTNLILMPMLQRQPSLSSNLKT